MHVFSTIFKDYRIELRRQGRAFMTPCGRMVCKTCSGAQTSEQRDGNELPIIIRPRLEGCCPLVWQAVRYTTYRCHCRSLAANQTDVRLQRYMAIGDQHRHDDRYVRDGVLNSEYSEPRYGGNAHQTRRDY